MSPPDQNETLQATLRRAAKGDEQAWRHLVSTYSARVFGLLRAQCNNDELAEEIAQSTFCTIVVKIDQYTEVGRFESWLFRNAMNRLRDEMRRRKRQAKPVQEEALAGLAGPGNPQEQTARADTDDLRALRGAMARLSDTDLQVIQLRHYGGLSFAQIAQVLDQPLGTVLARQYRALKKLRQLMGTDEPES